MSWNIAAECISTVVLCIIWIYSRKGNPIPNTKNRLFQASFLTTFCAMTSNILSTLLIYTLNPHTLTLTWLVNTVYFLTTPLMGMVYFLYSLANLYEGDPRLKRLLLLSMLPGAAYVALILINPYTRDVFDITLATGYTQGRYIASTYLIFYLYCLACVLTVLLRGKRVHASIRIILFTFPIIAALVIAIQVLAPDIVLTGSAATCALLLIYLYLQNKQISIDYLTQLPNRREFLKMLELKLKKGSRFAILVLSMREFKLINDVHGQHNGDALLAAVSGYLRRELGLREDALYRYSGDEFAVLLEKADESQVADLVERISRRIGRAWHVNNCTCMLSVAMGVAWCPDISHQTEGLINGIEYSVAVAKKDRDRSICYCTPELLEKAKRRQTIVELLNQKLKDDGFDVYYQPIINVSSRRFLAAEALLRMNTSSLGSVSPAEFIPIAEESGLIVEITYLVLDKVCRHIRRLTDEGIELEGVSVNFSALQFAQPDLLSRIVEIVKRNGVAFSQIKIELTESTLSDNPEGITQCIHQMHELGIRIGLDDFGTGYSNFASVIGLPIDIVKLDKSLVWSGVKEHRFAILVKNITRAFGELGMTVLAEGVENEQQRQFVEDCGCKLIQGFLFARPMPEDEFAQFLKKNQPSGIALGA